MDTQYAEAVQRLEDEIDTTCDRAAVVLSSKEIAAELRRLAADWEAHR